MSATAVLIRRATVADLAALHVLIETAYRGQSARQGWTHEADLLDGERIAEEALADLLAEPSERVLVAEADGALIGCVHVHDKGGGAGYLGLLSVDPRRQASGLGKRLLAAAEAQAAGFGADRIELTVITRRSELIDYYVRRGYRHTGERRAFPIDVAPPLQLLVLEKRLGR